MYFLPEARGRGLGHKMMAICLKEAKQKGFEQCYLETLPYMEAARKLYAKVGFKSLEGRMGDTGHYVITSYSIHYTKLYEITPLRLFGILI